MKANIGIRGNDIEEIATLLNTLLADEYKLYSKTRIAHWNVTGPNFDELHKFFKEQYVELDAILNDIAERIRSLGHFALGCMSDFLNESHLTDKNYNFGNPEQIIKTLFGDHETIIRIIRNEITPVSIKYKDLGTADFLTRLMQQHEKMAWLHRSFTSG